MRRKNSRVRIYWEDAVIYGPGNDSAKLGLSKKITEGEVTRESKEFFLIKDPRTSIYDSTTKKYIPWKKSQGATFFYLPKGMTKKVESL